jgi:hypothetical protein
MADPALLLLPEKMRKAVDGLLCSTSAEETAEAVRSLNLACGNASLCFLWQKNESQTYHSRIVLALATGLKPATYARLLSRKEDSAAVLLAVDLSLSEDFPDSLLEPLMMQGGLASLLAFLESYITAVPRFAAAAAPRPSSLIAMQRAPHFVVEECLRAICRCLRLLRVGQEFLRLCPAGGDFVLTTAVSLFLPQLCGRDDAYPLHLLHQAAEAMLLTLSGSPGGRSALSTALAGKALVAKLTAGLQHLVAKPHPGNYPELHSLAGLVCNCSASKTLFSAMSAAGVGAQLRALLLTHPLLQRAAADEPIDKSLPRASLLDAVAHFAEHPKWALSLACAAAAAPPSREYAEDVFVALLALGHYHPDAASRQLGMSSALSFARRTAGCEEFPGLLRGWASLGEGNEQITEIDQAMKLMHIKLCVERDAEEAAARYAQLRGWMHDPSGRAAAALAGGSLQSVNHDHIKDVGRHREAGSYTEPLAGGSSGPPTAGRRSSLCIACDVCGKTGVDMKRCSRCMRAFYCSTDCQIKGWNEGGHKLVCKPKA